MKRKMIISIIAIILFGALTVVIVMSQKPDADKYEQIASDLEARLRTDGVAFKEVKIDSKDPFTIEVVLPYINAENDSHLMIDKVKTSYLVHWELNQLNRDEFVLSSYIIHITDENGEKIGWNQRYLYPKESSGEPEEDKQYSLSEVEAEQYLRENLDLGTSRVDEFQLATETRSGQSLNTLSIKLTAPSLDILNRELPMANINPMLNRMENNSLYHINVCFLEIRSPEGEVWLYYIYDLDMRHEKWDMAEGVSQSWFPSPFPNDPMTPTSPTPRATPTERTYPINTPTQEATNIYP